MSLGKRIFKNTLWLSFSGIFFKGSLFFLSIYIARTLGSTEYGKISFALSFVALFVVISDFGIGNVIVKNISQQNSLTPKYLQYASSLKILLSLLTYILILLAINLSNETTEIRSLVYIAAIYVILNSFAQYFHSYFRAFEIMKFEATIKIIQSLSLLLLSILVLNLNGGLSQILGSYVLSAFIALIITIFFISRKVANFKLGIDKKFWIDCIKESWPFAVSAMFVEIYYYIDTVILSFFKGHTAVGFYSSAYNIVLIFTLLMATFIGVIFPIISKNFAVSRDKYRAFNSVLFKIILYLSLPLLISVYFGSDILIRLLLGEDYILSSLILKMLIWSVVILYNYAVFSIALAASNRQVLVTRASIIGALINIILNIILVPYFSYYGAAAATIFTEFIVGSIITYYYIKSEGTVINLSEIIKIGISTALMFIIISSLGVINIYLAITVGVVVYFLIGYLLRIYPVKQITEILNSLN